mmetsp:Transcript_39941/g.118918  ORF Transcript_39941/g.118918 Transcript_39941/m.118918 type:complete len:220 (+) Transcript_39941:439-1098(+)
MPGGVSARVARALRRVDSCRQPEPQRRRRLRGDKAHLATVDRVPEALVCHHDVLHVSACPGSQHVLQLVRKERRRQRSRQKLHVSLRDAMGLHLTQHCTKRIDQQLCNDLVSSAVGVRHGDNTAAGWREELLWVVKHAAALHVRMVQRVAHRDRWDAIVLRQHIKVVVQQLLVVPLEAVLRTVGRATPPQVQQQYRRRQPLCWQAVFIARSTHACEYGT